MKLLKTNFWKKLHSSYLFDFQYNKLPKGKHTRYSKDNNLVHFDLEPFGKLWTGFGE